MDHVVAVVVVFVVGGVVRMLGSERFTVRPKRVYIRLVDPEITGDIVVRYLRGLLSHGRSVG